jgi:hypothetical protein
MNEAISIWTVGRRLLRDKPPRNDRMELSLNRLLNECVNDRQEVASRLFKSLAVISETLGFSYDTLQLAAGSFIWIRYFDSISTI